MSLIQVDWSPPLRRLRHLGLICSLICAGVAVWRASASDPARSPADAELLALLAGALLFAGVAWRRPRWLRPVHVVLTALTLPIGYVVSALLLGVCFYGVMTPVGWLRRFLAGDPLSRRPDPAARTYWIARTPDDDPKRFFRQS